MWATVQKVLQECPACQTEHLGAPPHEAYRATVRPPLPGRGWSIDLVGPFLPDADGICYLVVAVDYLTNWVEAKPLPSKHAFRCAEWLFADIFARWGKPDWIRTDNGSEWESIFADLVRHWGVQHKHITVGNSKANGQAERMIRTIKDVIRK